MSGGGPTPPPEDIPATPQPLRLSPYTLGWLARHDYARTIVTPLWDALDEADRAGGGTTALRKLLLGHQPTPIPFRGRCTSCRRAFFPCIAWHQARITLGLPGWPSTGSRMWG